MSKLQDPVAIYYDGAKVFILAPALLDAYRVAKTPSASFWWVTSPFDNSDDKGR